MVRELPKSIAALMNEFSVQMIAEFHRLNTLIYRDKNLEILQDELTGGYWSTAESKIAPRLISEGWGTNEGVTLLPSRIKCKFLEKKKKTGSETESLLRTEIITRRQLFAQVVTLVQ